LRKGIVDDIRKYPFLGSMIFEVEDFYNTFSSWGKIDANIIINKSMEA